MCSDVELVVEMEQGETGNNIIDNHDNNAKIAITYTMHN